MFQTDEPCNLSTKDHACYYVEFQYHMVIQLKLQLLIIQRFSASKLHLFHSGQNAAPIL